MYEDRRDVTAMRYRLEIWRRRPGGDCVQPRAPKILENASTDGFWGHVGISRYQMYDGSEYKLVSRNTWIRPNKPDIRHSQAAVFFPSDECF
jgi:hypothetical protein